MQDGITCSRFEMDRDVSAVSVAELAHKLVTLHVADPTGSVTRFAMQLMGSNIASSMVVDERAKAEALVRRCRTEKSGDWETLQTLAHAWAAVPGFKQKA